MRKLICLIMLVGILAMSSIAIAENFLDVEMGPYQVDSYLSSEVIITNNSNKDLSYAILSIIIYYKGKMVDSKSRPITDIPSGQFQSKRFWFEAATSMDKYKYSFTNVRWK